MRGRTLDEVMAALPKARREAIKRGTRELIAAELSLRELRKAHKLTQARLAETLGKSQEVISRMEHNSDLLLSTLRAYVEALGGKLQLTAQFPGKPAVAIAGLGSLRDEARPIMRAHGIIKSGLPDLASNPTHLKGLGRAARHRGTARG